jgi:hypothetical protein
VKYFKIEELVDKNTFQKYGEDCWKLFQPNILDALDGVREFFGNPVTVNNWNSGGAFQFRGYRAPDCPVGALQSYHKRGMAFDFDVKGMTADVVRGMIMEHQNDPLLKNIMRMEAKVSWCHIDTKPVENRIVLFKG